MAHPIKRTTRIPSVNTRVTSSKSHRRPHPARALFDHTFDTCLVLNNRGRCVDANRAACALLGYSRAELVCLSMLELTPSAHAETARALLHALTMRRATRGDYQLVTKARRVIDVEYRAVANTVPGKHLVILREHSDCPDAQAQVRAALREKQVLLREIHHRVKNNLNVVAGLLELQANMAADTQAQDAFIESQKRIHAMALLHETLYQSPNLERIQIADYIHDLISYLQTAHTPDGDVDVLVQVDPVILNLDTATLCGLIINEWMTNAFKYAFTDTAPPPRENWRIAVTLKHHTDSITLHVRDNGVGLPPGFNWQHPHTLGLQLVGLFAQQLGGELRLLAEPGTAWAITFPAPPEYPRDGFGLTERN
ncbi:MAG: PAS domain S-box protein [Chloroflexi bacterium]|nr:PAS domain S-box protein [Chloroflexota bacterium]